MSCFTPPSIEAEISFVKTMSGEQTRVESKRSFATLACSMKSYAWANVRIFDDGNEQRIFPRELEAIRRCQNNAGSQFNIDVSSMGCRLF